MMWRRRRLEDAFSPSFPRTRVLLLTSLRRDVQSPSSQRQLFPVQINTLSGELDSNLDPEPSVQISHVF